MNEFNPTSTVAASPKELAESPDPVDAVWRELRREAAALVAEEPALKPLVDDVLLSRDGMAAALAARLARRLACGDMPRPQLEELLRILFESDPAIVLGAVRDLLAVRERDPACFSLLEPLLFFKGFLALSAYRASHRLWHDGRRWLALHLQSAASEAFAVDIHPAARIGSGILLDHATSFVVGETAVIEDNVSILHEVTLGGTGKQTGERHPIVRSGVLIGAGAKILGRVEIGTGAKIGSGSVVLEDVPPHTTVAGVPAVVVGEAAEQTPAIEMDQHLHCQSHIVHPGEGV
ncbi:MAG: serine O-acetyltransferase [Verrucomicrobia bacterium]|nr:serine O-acetyltransferase [Verrucomicrobiota bacterium]